MSTPYQNAWGEYLEAGYTPLPLPPRDKFPPPSGWTGGSKTNSGKTPPAAQCEQWIAEGYGIHKAWNIALRLPKDVVGIDVDMYDGKSGGATLAAAEEQWGALPPTWTSTSRTDGSGIRFFAVPEGLAWESRVGGDASGIEVVRWDHRYAVVFPSIHPNGEQYIWIDPEGTIRRDWVPSPGELAVLPSQWVDGLTNGRQTWQARPEAELSREEISGWIATRPGAEGSLCDEMEATLALWSSAVSKAGDGGGMHDAGRDGVWALLRDAAHGHAGIGQALARLKAVFRKTAVDRGKGRGGGLDGEWFRIVSMGVCKTAADVEVQGTDPCAEVGGAVTWTPELRQSIKAFCADRPALTDEGNSRRFHALYGEDVRWYGAEGLWLVWRGDRWERDWTGSAERKAKGVIRFVEDVEAGAVEGEDTDWFQSLKKHAKALGKRASRSAMLDDYKSIPGVSVVPDQLDADPRLVQCEGKLLRLGAGGVEEKLPLRALYQTLTTRVAYDASAQLDIWDNFLKRVMPDDEVRSWVQKAIGYSLLGGNPERLLFFIKGDTSTGKSVFAESVLAAVGDYGGTFDMTLFRSQKEQGPNVQLVRLLDKRVVFTSETSAERVLHGDQLKRISGNDRMSGRLIRSNEMVEKTPAFTTWIMTNEAPTIHGADKALYQRLLCVPFDQQIPVEERRVSLREELTASEEGRAAVLSWAVRGWEAYSAEGLRDVPSAVATATMQLRGELSNIDRWIVEECKQDAGFSATTEDLYNAYRIWAEDANIRDIEDRNIFGKRMAGRGFVKVRLRKSGERCWGLRGIRLAAGS